MLKMYQPHTHAGGTPEMWEENWGDSESAFDEALRYCELDPLRHLFEQYARTGTMMLEGGCGRGQYVTYYSSKGVNVIGMDFACNTLKMLRGRQESLLLCAGDVAALPYRDGVFDVYYSGGVVEHFEAGPGRALDEARRVLRPGGVLLISVPYLSPLRRVLTYFNRTVWRRVAHEEQEPATGPGWQFFQYIYSPREFETWLRKAGFKVVKKQGYAILWGLSEIRVFERLLSSISNSRKQSSGPAIENQPTVAPSRGRAPHLSLAKRLLMNEDDTIPVAGHGVRVLRWACANMMMYVCTRLPER
jgi:ubiquinone/menaquinone biosynthesis C-methylase UbiE